MRYHGSHIAMNQFQESDSHGCQQKNSTPTFVTTADVVSVRP